MNWWMHSAWEIGPVFLLSWVFWVIGSIVLHELGHGIAAIQQGDRTPIERGHMTINPVVHMGVPSLIAFAILGFAWGAMPVNPHRFKWGRYGDVFVSAAGPAVNVILAAICWVALALLAFVEIPEPIGGNLRIFFRLGGALNVVLCLLNLLPIPPLDGSRILGGLSRKAAEFYSRPEVMQYGFLAMMLFLFMVIPRIDPLGRALSLFP